jgi:hypothetical protein
MRTIAVRLTTAAILVFGAAASAHAQAEPTPPRPAPSAARPRPAPPRLPAAYLSLNGGAQFSQGDFQTNVTFPLYTEEADFDADYDIPAGIVFDLGGGVRLWRQFAAGVAVTRYQEDGHADLAARLPHPFFVGRPRQLASSIPDLERVETAVHVQVSWLAPVEERVTIAVFGGPTVFRVEQDIVTGLDLTEVFPFDEVPLASATTARREESGLGFHVGADVMYRVTKQVGVGAVARFSRGTLTTDTTAGGLQLTGGLRWLF